MKMDLKEYDDVGHYEFLKRYVPKIFSKNRFCNHYIYIHVLNKIKNLIISI